MREEEGRGLGDSRRPNIAENTKDLAQCERWRGQIVRNMSNKIAQIQNGMLGEHKIRELNDDINRLMREKSHWERQITSLGGAAHHSAVQLTDADGKVVVGPNGYVYFGAARNLPGVRELLEKQQSEIKKRTKADLYEDISCDYYGFRDDDDGLLIRLEKEAEARNTSIAVKRWESLESNAKKPRNSAGILKTSTGDLVTAHIPLPTEDEMKALILQRRKQALKEQLAETA